MEPPVVICKVHFCPKGDKVCGLCNGLTSAYSRGCLQTWCPRRFSSDYAPYLRANWLDMTLSDHDLLVRVKKEYLENRLRRMRLRAPAPVEMGVIGPDPVAQPEGGVPVAQPDAGEAVPVAQPDAGEAVPEAVVQDAREALVVPQTGDEDARALKRRKFIEAIGGHKNALAVQQEEWHKWEMSLI
jgi:hypothetical protein